MPEERKVDSSPNKYMVVVSGLGGYTWVADYVDHEDGAQVNLLTPKPRTPAIM